jgi:photosystem II stability/assembly factor-like uncharacterized protein
MVARITRLILLALLCVAALACVAGPAAAVTTGSGHWTWQSPLPSGGWLADTSFIGAEGWGVSGSGDVLHTTDGGATWDTLATGESDALYAVQFISATEGWVAGEWGSVLHTTDGGATWERQVSGTLDSIINIDFVDAQHGWLTGYSSVSATTDGGATWILQMGGDVSFSSWWYGQYSTGETYSDAEFVDAQHGVVVGTKPLVRQAEDYAGVAWSTADGGATWTETQVDGVRGFNTVTSQGTGYWAAGADNAIAHTDDGVHWTRDTVSAPVALYGIAMTAGGQGWAVGYGDSSDWFSDSSETAGIVLHSTDGGDTWSPVADPLLYADTLVDVRFSDADHGRIVGSSGVIYVTSDAGTTWAKVGPERAAPVSFTAITRAPDGLLWAVGSAYDPNYGESGGGVVWRSKDAGATWEAVHDNLLDAGSLSEVYAAAGGEAWVAGDGGRILHTTDGGDTWELQATGIGAAITGIAFTDAEHGWAISSGLRGVVLKTADAGAHWVLTPVGTLERFFSLQASGDDIWLGGMAYRSECEEEGTGTLLHSGDGGATWTSTAVGKYATTQISFPGGGAEGWALAGVPYMGESAAQLLHTTDGGATWKVATVGPQHMVRRYSAMWFSDADEGWLLADGNFYGTLILHTVDGGVHWGAIDIADTWGLGAVYFSGLKDGWVAGQDNAIIATTDGGGMAPITMSNLSGTRWTREDFTLKVTTTDDGLGLGSNQIRVGDGAWEDRDSVAIRAPKSHANDGYHLVRYRGVDLAGNHSPVQPALVAVDTRPPSLTTHDRAKARYMTRAGMRIKAYDSFSPWVRVTMDVVSATGKKMPRIRSSAASDGQWHAFRYICRLAPGTYRVTLSVSDIAGNRCLTPRTLTLTVTGH